MATVIIGAGVGGLAAAIDTEKKAEGRGVEVSSLADPPALRAGQLAWCPRCRTPYRQASGTCADCQVPLSSTT